VVNGLPVGAITVAPIFRQRSASRMSPVITTAPASARSAIQSSAASNASLTIARDTSGCCGMRMIALLTTVTGTS